MNFTAGISHSIDKHFWANFNSQMSFTAPLNGNILPPDEKAEFYLSMSLLLVAYFYVGCMLAHFVVLELFDEEE